jgi:choline dehydrogenase-like flavoprotein
MTYLRGATAESNSWEELGNPEWNWESLLPFYKKAENLTVPTTGETFDTDIHDFGGPLRTEWLLSITRGLGTTIFNETWKNMRLPYNLGPNGGQMRGFNVRPWTVDVAANVREDFARAWYLPATKRPNPHLFLKKNGNQAVLERRIGFSNRQFGCQRRRGTPRGRYGDHLLRN